MGVGAGNRSCLSFKCAHLIEHILIALMFQFSFIVVYMLILFPNSIFILKK